MGLKTFILANFRKSEVGRLIKLRTNNVGNHRAFQSCSINSLAIFILLISENCEDLLELAILLCTPASIFFSFKAMAQHFQMLALTQKENCNTQQAK